MSGTLRQRLWLAWLPLLLCVLDGCLTMTGQPAEYWQGEYGAARELNPLFDVMLRWHPWAAVVGFAGWVAVLTTAVLLLPLRLAVGVAFAGVLGHACGAASWIVSLGVAGWVLAIALLLTAERLMAWSWKRAAVGRGPPEPER